jgi:hypothetical protein
MASPRKDGPADGSETRAWQARCAEHLIRLGQFHICGIADDGIMFRLECHRQDGLFHCMRRSALGKELTFTLTADEALTQAKQLLADYDLEWKQLEGKLAESKLAEEAWQPVVWLLTDADNNGIDFNSVLSATAGPTLNMTQPVNEHAREVLNRAFHRQHCAQHQALRPVMLYVIDEIERVNPSRRISRARWMREKPKRKHYVHGTLLN